MLSKNTAVLLVLLAINSLIAPLAAYSKNPAEATAEIGNQNPDETATLPLRYQAPIRIAILRPDEIVKAVNIKPGDVILDIGAGTGVFTFRFAEALKGSGAVFATDISKANIRYLSDKVKEKGCRNVFPVPVQPAGPDAFYKEHLFDIIFLCDVYEYIYRPEEYFGALRPFLAKETGRLYIMYFKSDNILFEEEFNDFERTMNILASYGSDFPITRRMRKELRDFISSFRKGPVPEEIKRRIIEDFNGMLYDRKLLGDLNTYFVIKENNVSFLSYVNEVNRYLAKWLIESLDREGVFKEDNRELSDREKRELRQLNKILIKAFSLSPIVYRGSDWIHISKESVIAQMKRVGYILVRDRGFPKYYDLLEFKRKD